MRILLLTLACLTSAVLADEPSLRPSAKLLFKQPEMLRPGSCVRYEEGGAGWVATDPVFYLKGEVLASEDQKRGIVRLRVTDWETPHAVRAANAGRLYRGMFIDRKLEKGMEIELEADLLTVCER